MTPAGTTLTASNNNNGDDDDAEYFWLCPWRKRSTTGNSLSQLELWVLPERW